MRLYLSSCPKLYFFLPHQWKQNHSTYRAQNYLLQSWANIYSVWIALLFSQTLLGRLFWTILHSIRYIKCTLYPRERFSWWVSRPYNVNIYRCRSYLLSSQHCTCKLLYYILHVPSNPIIYNRKRVRRSLCPSSLRRSDTILRRTFHGSSTKWDTRLEKQKRKKAKKTYLKIPHKVAKVSLKGELKSKPNLRVKDLSKPFSFAMIKIAHKRN